MHTWRMLLHPQDAVTFMVWTQRHSNITSERCASTTKAALELGVSALFQDDPFSKNKLAERELAEMTSEKDRF